MNVTGTQTPCYQ